eukprot:730-Chlamydomonas_euryale.AAC.13
MSLRLCNAEGLDSADVVAAINLDSTGIEAGAINLDSTGIEAGAINLDSTGIEAGAINIGSEI